ncbi:MAG: prepilin-type N-terminal cleavage/methylation domain-containing protein [Candidatus Omnitrophota bacterium]
MKNKFKGMTLVELLVGLVLLSIIVLGLSQIDLFSRTQVLRTDRQAVLQNELGLILSHMDKTGMRVVGNEVIYGSDTTVRSQSIGGLNQLDFYVDADNNNTGNRDGLSQRPAINNPNSSDDHWVSYQLVLANNNLQYCGRCRNINNCNNCMAGLEVLGTHIVTARYQIVKPVNVQSELADNYIYVEMTACWNPTGNPDPCGTTTLNPQVTMHTVINLPMVSAH